MGFLCECAVGWILRPVRLGKHISVTAASEPGCTPLVQAQRNNIACSHAKHNTAVAGCMCTDENASLCVVRNDSTIAEYRRRHYALGVIAALVPLSFAQRTDTAVIIRSDTPQFELLLWARPLAPNGIHFSIALHRTFDAPHTDEKVQFSTRACSDPTVMINACYTHTDIFAFHVSERVKILSLLLYTPLKVTLFGTNSSKF